MTSIFEQYYSPPRFIDRKPTEEHKAVDVIIPIIHTNELWKSNLLSYYREIPINRLLIGDGGCIDNSIGIVKEFPRVVVHDHIAYRSLGYSIRKLIEAVETEWFVYLHSDVHLPDGWFDAMCKNRKKYDWFECSQNLTFLVEYRQKPTPSRAYSGSQMGRKSIFKNVLPQIDDDYLYRNEDIILSELVKKEGGRYGNVTVTYHNHQVMHKESTWGRKVKRMDIELEIDPKEEIRALDTQIRGFIKYLPPRRCKSYEILKNLKRLDELGGLDDREFRGWVKAESPRWLKYIDGVLERMRIEKPIKRRVADTARRISVKWAVRVVLDYFRRL